MAAYNTSMLFFSFSMSEMEKCQHNCIKCTVDMCIESDSGGKVSMFGSTNISHCGERVHMNRRLILNGYRDIVVWMSRPNSIKFLFLRGWMKSKGYKRKGDTRDKLIAHILDAAACIKKHEDQLRQMTCDLHLWVTKCIEGDSGIFKHLLWYATNMSFPLWQICCLTLN